MRIKTCFLVLTAILVFFCEITFAIPTQEDFYHKIYKIEWKGLSGKVLTRSANSPSGSVIPLFENVSLSSAYTGSASQQWIIIPISPNSSEFYIINRETGYPLTISKAAFNITDLIRCNMDGTTDDNQRFKFKNANGDYFQIQSASTTGCFYHFIMKVWSNGLGSPTYDYYSLSYTTDPNLNDDYSYFKLTEVGDIPGSSNVTAANLVYQPDLLFNIPQPPNLTSYDDTGAMLYSNETVIGESWVPFSLINDDAYSILGQLAGTPFYKIIRKQAWKKVKDISWQPGAVFTVTYKSYQGITQGETHTTQLTLEHSWSMNGSVEFAETPIKLTLGRTYTEKLSRSFTQVNSYTENAWDQQDQTLVFNTPYGVRVVIYELVDRYYVKRMDGTEVVTPFEIIYREYTAHKTWPSEGLIMSKDPITGSITISHDYTIPAAPTGITLSSASGTNGNVKVSWTKNTETNVTSYEVYREDVDEGSGWQLIGTTALTYFVDPQYSYVPIGGQVTCKYKVRAKNTLSIYSAFSAEASVRAEPKYGTDGATADLAEEVTPTEYAVSQNYPNPFNPSTIISYDIPEAAEVTLKVYDLLGREVADLVNEYKEAGRYNVTFDASHLSTGIYIYQLRANNYVSVKKMSFVK